MAKGAHSVRDEFCFHIDRGRPRFLRDLLTHCGRIDNGVRGCECAKFWFGRDERALRNREQRERRAVLREKEVADREQVVQSAGESRTNQDGRLLLLEKSAKRVRVDFSPTPV